jgi:uncharacterized membrane protein YcgQ (UPF0703/DUF1980 family)
MGHDHHHGGDVSTYYVEQLCTIGVCGAFGAVAIMLYSRNTLRIFLDPKFHPFVLGAGIALLVMVAIRAVSVWQTAGGAADHNHDHCHGHDCSHDHEHDHHDHDHEQGHDHAHVHSHDHGHDHSWNPWRYAVLLLPIVLFFLNLPNQGFSSDWFKSRAVDLEKVTTTNAFISSELGIQLTKSSSGDSAQVEKVTEPSPAFAGGIKPRDVITKITRTTDADGRQLSKPEVTSTQGLALDAVVQKLQGKAGTKITLTIQPADGSKSQDVELVCEDQVIDLEFKELERAALTELQRDYYTGRKGRVKGQFSPSSRERYFTLMRLKMVCCVADVTPLKVLIEAPDSVSKFQTQEWVEVEGQIRFDQAPGQFIPVLKVLGMDKIRRIPPEPDNYVR